MFFSYPTFMGTDWEGDIYVMDPLTSESCVLKRFDKNGRFREMWQPIDSQLGKAVAVTQDGYIWTGLARLNPEDYAGMPIVVYRKGKKSPVFDWRHKVPRAVDERIRKELKEMGLEWKRGWMMRKLEGVSKQVSLRFTGEGMGQEGSARRGLWTLLRAYPKTSPD
jgi:hypothetical protein